MFGVFESWGVLELQELTDGPLDSWTVIKRFLKQGHLERLSFCSYVKADGIEMSNIL